MSNKKAFVLIPALIIISLLLVIGIFFITFTVSEKKIADSYSISQQAYHLAESGIEFAIWKLKSDTAWKTSFETNPTWHTTYDGTSFLYPGGSFQISIQNSDLAKADIIATSTLMINDRKSQRVIKTKVFKALGGSAIGNNAMLAEGDIEISSSNIAINGSFSTKSDIGIENSNLNITNAIQSFNGDINSTGSVITAAEISAENYPPAPTPIIDLPGISFDDPHDPLSLKEQAEALGQNYSGSEFSALLASDPYLTLNGVVFVNGSVDIKDGEHPTINGALACTGNITIGSSAPCSSDDASLTINHVVGQPSGIFTKSNMTFEQCVSGIQIEGIAYAHNKMELDALNSDFVLTGSILGKTISISSITHQFQITHDTTIINETLNDDPTFSPVITIEFWEEEY